MTLVYVLNMYLLNVIIQVLLEFLKIQCNTLGLSTLKLYITFLKIMYKKNNITLEFVDTKDQLAYIFAKPLNED